MAHTGLQCELKTTTLRNNADERDVRRGMRVLCSSYRSKRKKKCLVDSIHREDDTQGSCLNKNEEKECWLLNKDNMQGDTQGKTNLHTQNKQRIIARDTKDTAHNNITIRQTQIQLRAPHARVGREMMKVPKSGNELGQERQLHTKGACQAGVKPAERKGELHTTGALRRERYFNGKRTTKGAAHYGCTPLNKLLILQKGDLGRTTFSLSISWLERSVHERLTQLQSEVLKLFRKE